VFTTYGRLEGRNLSTKAKPKCPKCKSEDVKVLSLPLGDEEEFIYCNKCKQVSVITKVKVSDKQDEL